MTEKLLDISCPVCGKRDKASWVVSFDDCVFMFCERCDNMYQVMNNGDKHVMGSMTEDGDRMIVRER